MGWKVPECPPVDPASDTRDPAVKLSAGVTRIVPLALMLLSRRDQDCTSLTRDVRRVELPNALSAP